MPDAVDAATDATRRWWRQTDRYGALLLVLIIDYLLALLIGSTPGGQPLLLITTILSLVLALHTSGVQGRPLWIILGACGVAVLIAGIEQVRHDGSASALVNLVVGVLLLGTPVSILRRILSYHRFVSTETLAAALCTYLLIGIAFANLFSAVVGWDSGAFDGIDTTNRLPDLVYFSFVTITTVGYGDITPSSDIARSLAVTEALMGQIVLVAFVGRIVGLMPNQRSTHGVRDELATDRERIEEVAHDEGGHDEGGHDDPEHDDAEHDEGPRPEG